MGVQMTETTMDRPTKFTARDRQWIRGTRDGFAGRYPDPPTDPDLARAYEAAYQQASETAPGCPVVGVATVRQN